MMNYKWLRQETPISSLLKWTIWEIQHNIPSDEMVIRFSSKHNIGKTVVMICGLFSTMIKDILFIKKINY